MKAILDTIPAEALFGAESRLVEQVGSDALSGVASLGAIYQGATAIVALLFIFILVHYFSLFRHLILSSFSKQHNHSDIHIFAAELKNIRLFTSLMGVLLISLLIMRLSVESWAWPISNGSSALSVWELGGIAFGGIVITMLGERLLLYFAGIISGRRDACQEIWRTKLLYFSLVIILLSPMLILALLTEGTTTQVALCASVAICLLSLILFIKETFLLFRTQRFSIFHWILYLCALEIFPLSLLLAPIARG